MKILKASIYFFALLFMISCGSNSQLGEKVKEPFTGSKYESNNSYFRATGKGISSKDNIARSKADLDAKNQLAGQVSTTMKNVTDQYIAETDDGDASEIADQFQSLTRQVMSTGLADLRKFDEEKYHNGTQYTVFVAYEIKKNAMFRFMKKKARTDAKVDKKTLQTLEAILDMQIEATEE